jgi:ATP-dependent protease ClpP protease subunit
METNKITKRFELSVSQEKPNVTVVYMYGYVTDEHWFRDEEVIYTKEVREKLQSITTPEIELHINSPGGNAFDGIAIHNLLKQHSAKVTAYVDGWAASAASVILMAADKIIMPANTMLMIHGAWTFACGNAAELRNKATMLEKLDSAVRASYQSRFVGTEDELSALLETDTWLTAEEAKALGLCDEVYDAAPDAPPKETQSTEPPKNAILEKYGFKANNSKHEPLPKPKATIYKGLLAFFIREEKKV